jgi:hypothetical protein
MSGTVSRRRGSYQGGIKSGKGVGKKSFFTMMHYKDKHFPSTASPAEALAKVGQPPTANRQPPTANPCKGDDVLISLPDPVLTGMK